MTAPTGEEIRLAVLRSWGRERVADKLEEALGFNLGTAAAAELWDFPERDGQAYPDRWIDDAIAPILEDVRARSLDAIATALQAFAADHPNVPRRKRRVSADV